MAEQSVVFVDIDDTIAKLMWMHYQAYRNMFVKIYGINSDIVNGAGSGGTVKDVILFHMKRSGLPEEKILNRVEDAYFCLAQETDEILSRNGSIKFLPGIKHLLYGIANMENVSLAIHTGNVTPVTKIMLKHLRIDHIVEFYCCGEEAENRNEFLSIGIQRGQELKCCAFSRIYVIDDSVKGIIAARANNAVSIAVATGVHSMEQLAAESPDFLFENFGDKRYNQVLEIIGNNHRG